ncbi:hypothetical protein ACLBXO_00075 [Methylobacterium sp. C33D]
MSNDWNGRVFTNGVAAVPFITLGIDVAQGSEDPARIPSRGRLGWVLADEVDDTPWNPQPDPGAAAYARCAEECRERQSGEPECTDTCLRADEARRKA